MKSPCVSSIKKDTLSLNLNNNNSNKVREELSDGSGNPALIYQARLIRTYTTMYDTLTRVDILVGICGCEDDTLQNVCFLWPSFWIGIKTFQHGEESFWNGSEVFQISMSRNEANKVFLGRTLIQPRFFLSFPNSPAPSSFPFNPRTRLHWKTLPGIKVWHFKNLDCVGLSRIHILYFFCISCWEGICLLSGRRKVDSGLSENHIPHVIFK